MYEEFYGLKERPFVLTPDPQFLYLSEGHRTAIESLLYGIRHREGFMVIIGDIGTGKTTIIRTLLEKLDEGVKTALIFNSFLTEEELLESILQEYGFPSKGRSRKERIDALNKLLLHYLTHNKNALLIIDEAQHLSIPVLEQIRMLSNLETEKEKMIQIILVGQLELDQKLRSPELKQLNQRIAIRHHLQPLTRAEMESYIYQRLQVAGANGNITFSKSALDETYKFSKGIPRLINLLCDRSLLGGFVDQTHHIDKGIVKKAEKSLLGEEGQNAPSRAWALLRFFTPLRILLLTISLMFVCAILIRQDHFSFRQTGGLDGVWPYLSGMDDRSIPAIFSGKKRVQDLKKVPSDGREENLRKEENELDY
ncbi:MAG: AAA family ATPase [Syntrophaceae bacterium]|nr:AAA family ATPase [Syntrophaceae bacterium]